MTELSQPPADPFALFADWLKLAEAQEPNDPNAMALATASRDGMPSVRMVLLRGCDAKGFVFYTNRESRKGAEMEANPQAAMCWHWKSLRRQIRAEGSITRATDAESDAYFASRARGSQLGAWASSQSRVLVDRAKLEERYVELEQQYEGKPVPRPPYWGGYRLTPRRIEFWQDGRFRLHDRVIYKRADAASSWIIERLYP